MAPLSGALVATDRQGRHAARTVAWPHARGWYGTDLRPATLRLAHRGDWRWAPENSLRAVVAALAVKGCDGVEIDVRAARDGTPVLLHDRTLDRVHGRPEAAAELTPPELGALGVPTLAAALAVIPAWAFLDVDIKDQRDLTIVDVLEDGRGRHLANTIVSSFDPAIIAAVRSARPGWACWLNTTSLSPASIVTAAELGCAGISVRWTAIDPVGIRRASQVGLEVAAWTVRRPRTFERLSRLGVTAICAEAAALDGVPWSGVAAHATDAAVAPTGSEPVRHQASSAVVPTPA